MSYHNDKRSFLNHFNCVAFFFLSILSNTLISKSVLVDIVAEVAGIKSGYETYCMTLTACHPAFLVDVQLEGHNMTI